LFAGDWLFDGVLMVWPSCLFSVCASAMCSICVSVVWTRETEDSCISRVIKSILVSLHVV
jgi:putative exporter of polyketide antibiotics